MGWGLCTVAGVAGKGETLDIVPRFLITGRRVAGSSFGGIKGRDEVPQLVERWLAGEIDVDPFLSHRLTLDEVNRGFELMEAQDGIRSVIALRLTRRAACVASRRRLARGGAMCLPGTIETVRARVEEEGLPKLDRRTALLGAAGAAVAAALPGRALGAKLPTNRLQDLTHEFREGFPGFLGAPAVLDRQVTVTIPANGFYGQTWTFWEHNCTALGRPGPLHHGGRFSPEMSLDELVRPLVVVDISARAAAESGRRGARLRPRRASSAATGGSRAAPSSR